MQSSEYDANSTRVEQQRTQEDYTEQKHLGTALM